MSARGGRWVGVGFVGVAAPLAGKRRAWPTTAGGAAQGRGALGVDPGPVERASGKGSVLQLVAQQRVRARAGAAVDDLALAVDDLAAALGPVYGLSGEAKKLDSADVGDVVGAMDGVPQAQAVRPEGARRLRAGRVGSDQGEGRSWRLGHPIT